jgi:hypothetical protein
MTTMSNAERRLAYNLELEPTAAVLRAELDIELLNAEIAALNADRVVLDVRGRLLDARLKHAQRNLENTEAVAQRVLEDEDAAA